MDLFDDLPEPGKPKDSNTPAVTENLTWGTVKVDFFSDLPLPSSTTGTRGVKRKLEDKNSFDEFVDRKEDLYAIQGFYAEKKGEREEMQDFHVVIDDFHKHTPDLHSSVSRLSYYAVFDGHGGVRASQFASAHLHQNVALKFPKGIHSVPV